MISFRKLSEDWFAMYKILFTCLSGKKDLLKINLQQLAISDFHCILFNIKCWGRFLLGSQTEYKISLPITLAINWKYLPTDDKRHLAKYSKISTFFSSFSIRIKESLKPVVIQVKDKGRINQEIRLLN